MREELRMIWLAAKGAQGQLFSTRASEQDTNTLLLVDLPTHVPPYHTRGVEHLGVEKLETNAATH